MGQQNQPQSDAASRGVAVERTFGSTKITPLNERATEAAAAQAKALIQARFIMAMQNTRNILQVRDSILASCRRLRFAAMATYMKPQKGAKACDYLDCPKREPPDNYGNMRCHFVCGPSIRFADEAVKALGNCDIRQDVTYEDDTTRIDTVSALDLETNLCKHQTVTVQKTVERRKVAEGAEVLGERTNSYGDLVYIVRATDDEFGVKEANLCAKARRNQELQLLPGDIIEDAMDEVRKTIRADIDRDPKKAAKAVCDAFTSLGVSPAMLEKYLTHPVEASTPAEIEALRKGYATIKDGQATWAQFAGKTEEEKPGEKKGSKLAAGRRKVEIPKAPESPKEQPKSEEESGKKLHDEGARATVLADSIETALADGVVTTEAFEAACTKVGVDSLKWNSAGDEKVIALATELMVVK